MPISSAACRTRRPASYSRPRPKRRHRGRQGTIQRIETEIHGRAHTAEHRMGNAAGEEGDTLDDHIGAHDPAADARQQRRRKGGLQEGVL